MPDDAYDAYREIFEEAKRYFTQIPHYAFEKKLGSGASGVAMCFVDTQLGGSKFVVKVGDDEDIRNEMTVLQGLRWAMHIVWLLRRHPDPAEIAPPPMRPFNKPFLILEYLANGSLRGFIDRHNEGVGRRPPNRVLWAIFLCFVRACVALAHPPVPMPEDDEKQLERIPETLPGFPSSLAHMDMHDENFMFGDLIPSETTPEHLKVPILKLIDFGYADEEPNPIPDYNPARFDAAHNLARRHRDDFNRINALPVQPASYAQPFVNPGRYLTSRSAGMRRNIQAIGIRMILLMINDQNAWAGLTEARDLMSDLIPVKATYDPNLDDDMVWLVAQCLSEREANQPSVAQLAALVEGFCLSKTEHAYPGMPEETDQYIDNLVKEYILNAG